MYKLTKVKLRNICQYSEIEIPIELGLMAVCGKNGIGKTNVLRGLVYGLTGLVDGSWGTQQSLQKDDESVPGYVEVTLESAENTLVIKRFSTSSIKLPDSVNLLTDKTATEVAVRRKAVDKYLSDVYGISCQLLFQICWGRQGQMDSLLTATAAAVSTFLATIFDTKKLETLRDKLKISRDTIAHLSSGAQEALEKDAEALKALPAIEEMQISLTNAREALEGLQTRLVKINEIVTEGTSPDDWAARKASLEDTIRREQALLKRPPLQEPETRPGLPSASYHKRLQEASDYLVNINNQFTSLNTEYVGLLDEIHRLEENMQTRVSLYDSIKAQLNVSDSECHLCKGKIVDTVAYNNEKCKLLTTFSNIEEYDEKHQKFTDEIQQTITAKQMKAEQLNETLTTTATYTREALEQKEIMSNSFELALQAENYDKRIADDVNSKELIRNSLMALKALLALKPLTQEVFTEQKALQSQVSDMQQVITKLENDIAETKANKTYLEMSIKTNTKYAAKYEINVEASRLLATLRDIFSQSRAQARYLASKIEELNVKIASFLEKAEMPFSLSLNPETRVFEYTNNQGYVHPAAHLSGAQKSISAVAIQMAVFETVQPSINIFLVDEPSEALDIENKVIMAELFQRMNNMLPAIQGVMLIVSRDEQLINSCENIINIEESV